MFEKNEIIDNFIEEITDGDIELIIRKALIVYFAANIIPSLISNTKTPQGDYDYLIETGFQIAEKMVTRTFE